MRCLFANRMPKQWQSITGGIWHLAPLLPELFNALAQVPDIRWEQKGLMFSALVLDEDLSQIDLTHDNQINGLKKFLAETETSEFKKKDKQ